MLKMKKSTIIKIQETINALAVPMAGIAAIWGLDISVYTAAIAQGLNTLLEIVLKFVKD